MGNFLLLDGAWYSGVSVNGVCMNVLCACVDDEFDDECVDSVWVWINALGDERVMPCGSVEMMYARIRRSHCGCIVCTCWTCTCVIVLVCGCMATWSGLDSPLPDRYLSLPLHLWSVAKAAILVVILRQQDLTRTIHWTSDHHDHMHYLPLDHSTKTYEKRNSMHKPRKFGQRSEGNVELIWTFLCMNQGWHACTRSRKFCC